MLIPLNEAAVERIVRLALDEDAPWGDLTSQTLVPAEARLTASLVAREPGVLAGAALFTAAMRLTDPATRVTFLKQDAEPFSAGEVLAHAEGPARSILQAERVALNFVQRLSGIATLTANFVAHTAGTKARIVDTRKTTPGLRYFERYAVRCGGGHNHRFSLSDAVMAKDNHLAALLRSDHDRHPERSEGPLYSAGTGRNPQAQPSGPAHSSASPENTLTSALRAAREHLPHTTHIEVEVDRLDQIEPILAAGVDTIMLDNFSLEDIRQAVHQINGRALIEASGNVRLDTVAAIAQTGVDIISVGALTHSVRSLDLGLDIL